MLNFETKTGTPITLDGEMTPTFYIDAGDFEFIEKVHKLYKKLAEYLSKSKIEMHKIEKDIHGIPVNSDMFIESMKNEYDFILNGIDELLGEGVSSKIFKGRYNQDLLAKFLNFLVDAIKKERVEHVEKYTKKENKGVL